MNFMSFEDPEEMFKFMDAQRAAADGQITWQGDLKPGDFACAYSPEADVWIFYQILDPVEEEKKAFHETGEDEESLEQIRELYAQPHMKNYRFTRAFSELCPEGELGDMHLSTISLRMSALEFDTARQSNWVLLNK